MLGLWRADLHGLQECPLRVPLVIIAYSSTETVSAHPTKCLIKPAIQWSILLTLEVQGNSPWSTYPHQEQHV